MHGTRIVPTFPLKIAATIVALLLIQSCGRAQTLYDPSLGNLPETQGWTAGGLGTASEMMTNGLALLDTSTTASTQAGWSQVLEPGLDRTKGFALLFRAQLDAEAHKNTNRAGFSVILISDDKRGIELGFWTNRIFAQSDSPLFTHAEDAAFATTTRLANYALAILGSNYVLRANGVPLLAGPIRDYTAFGGFLSPYRIPGFLFLGDDTTSAGGVAEIGRVALIRPVVLTSVGPGLISWSGVSTESYTVQSSSDLAFWTDVGTVTSTSAAFSFTNSLLQAEQFLRVVYP